MSMDAESRDGGRLHFSLGPVERWVVGAVATAAIGMVLWVTNATTSRLDTLTVGMNALNTQQQVTNTQLLTMSNQLADVPTLKLEVAKQAVQVDQLQQDVKELRQLRGIK